MTVTTALRHSCGSELDHRHFTSGFCHTCGEPLTHAELEAIQWPKPDDRGWFSFACLAGHLVRASHLGWIGSPCGVPACDGFLALLIADKETP